VKAGDVFKSSMDDDLNISEALAGIFDMIHAGNREMDAGRAGWSAPAVLALLAQWDTVLGVFARPAASLPADVQQRLDARAAARASRNWAESDRLRDVLLADGWEVRDTPEGQKLKKR
jgi:cysteinyl-tRNA synthetase